MLNVIVVSLLHLTTGFTFKFNACRTIAQLRFKYLFVIIHISPRVTVRVSVSMVLGLAAGVYSGI